MFDRLKNLLKPTSAAPPEPDDFERLEAVLAPIREELLLDLKDWLDKARQQEPERSILPEVLVKLPAPSNFPRNYYRADFTLPKSDEASGGAKLIDIETPLQQPSATSLEVAGLLLILQPFSWGQCQFLLAGEAQPEIDGELLQWYDHWIKTGDDQACPGTELKGVLHSAAFYRMENGLLTLVFDFGSAPIKAFLELVRLIARNFKGQVRIDADFEEPAANDVS